jgi:hypothetical protein
MLSKITQYVEMIYSKFLLNLCIVDFAVEDTVPDS